MMHLHLVFTRQYIMQILLFIYQDEKNQVIVTSIWLRQYWHDDILVWNASEYQCLNQLHLTTKDIWVPDIALYNT